MNRRGFLRACIGAAVTVAAGVDLLRSPPLVGFWRGEVLTVPAESEWIPTQFSVELWKHLTGKEAPDYEYEVDPWD